MLHRSGAANLASLFPGIDAVPTVDTRTRLELARAAPQGGPLAPMELAAVVFPSTGQDRSLESLSPADALARLLPCARMWNVVDPSIQARHFSTCAAVARNVPAYDLSLSEGYWLSAGVGSTLVELAIGVPAR